MSEPLGGAQRRIYLDYHATTPVDPRVADVVLRHMTGNFGNASSADHTFGDDAADSVEVARVEIARLVGAEACEVVFTSGATEAINLGLRGVVRQMRRRVRIALMPVEHPAVIETCRALAAEGSAELINLSVDQMGRLDIQDVEAACRGGADLVCTMAANNEVGTLYPLEAIGAACARYGAILFSDATQAAGKIPLEMGGWGIGLVALAPHKFYGPKGVGALVVRRGMRIEPLLHGGAQQRRIRPGTLNVPGIAGFGEAARLRSLEMTEDETRVATLRDALRRRLDGHIPDMVLNGDPVSRLAGNLHVSVPDVPNTAVVARIRHRLAISTGSACSAGVVAQSHVVRALGLPDRLAEGALRFGVGKFTTPSEIEEAAELVAGAVSAIRAALAR